MNIPSKESILSQVTLDEADAILAEFGSKVAEEETEDKGSSKQNVSSEDMDTGEAAGAEDAEMPDLQEFAVPEVKK